jgi:hypothetical protein
MSCQIPEHGLRPDGKGFFPRGQALGHGSRPDGKKFPREDKIWKMVRSHMEENSREGTKIPSKTAATVSFFGFFTSRMT